MIALLASPLARWVIGALAALALVGTLYALWQRAAADADEWQTKARTEASLRIAAERRTAALERASVERAADATDLRNLEQGLTDAIDKAAATEPNRAPGAATRALGCQRLQRAGQDATAEYRRLCG